MLQTIYYSDKFEAITPRKNLPFVSKINSETILDLEAVAF